MAVWQYNDWITQSDQTTRLTRLRLHIAEVSEKLLGFKRNNAAHFPVDQDYLKQLMAQESALSAAVEQSGFWRNAIGVARSRVKFRR
jgi:hypothetical protein